MSARVNRSEARKREVTTEAVALFERDGYHATNMVGVAEAVGMKKPTLYHYFSGKQAILFSIHEEFIDLLLEKYERRRGSALSAAEEIHALMADTFDVMTTHRGHIQVFFENYRELSDADQITIRGKRDRYQHIVEETVARGIRDGEFRALDPRLTSLALLGMCNWAFHWFEPTGARTGKEIADLFFDILLNGLRQ